MSKRVEFGNLNQLPFDGEGLVSFCLPSCRGVQLISPEAGYS